MAGYEEIVWYGERGVVNAFVIDIVSQGKGSSFLRSILWASGHAPDWIDEVIETSFLVEHGFAQFGNPDLIVICRTRRDETQVVFVEAKAIPYLASAIDNTLGMQGGFNSRINGQLSLRYRLARALSGWDGESRDLREARRRIGVSHAQRRSADRNAAEGQGVGRFCCELTPSTAAPKVTIELRSGGTTRCT